MFLHIALVIYVLTVLYGDSLLQSDAMLSLLQCVLLSFTSALDNFAVGASLGVHQRPLSQKLNCIVSVFNAAGALFSSGVGVLLGSQGTTIEALLCVAIFVWLGLSEAESFRRDEASPLADLAATGTWTLALPMTLNNLAGGVAGGLAGIRPFDMFVGSLVASYVMMFAGHLLAKRGMAAVQKRASALSDPRAIAATTFLCLALKQLMDAVGNLMGVLILLTILVMWAVYPRMAGVSLQRKQKSMEVFDV